MNLTLKSTAAALACAMAVATVQPAMAQRHGHHGYHGHRGHHGWNGGRIGAGIAGLAAGAIIGGALNAQRGYYYDEPGYAYGPGYGAYAADPNAVAYCEQRFKTYDPRTGTYMGYDGQRHRCP